MAVHNPAVSSLTPRIKDFIKEWHREELPRTLLQVGGAKQSPVKEPALLYALSMRVFDDTLLNVLS